tara:strand:+ start:4580 stop:4834 length:255 start_codon:yes stop_codon:yes gene_type:complete
MDSIQPDPLNDKGQKLPKLEYEEEMIKTIMNKKKVHYSHKEIFSHEKDKQKFPSPEEKTNKVQELKKEVIKRRRVKLKKLGLNI